VIMKFKIDGGILAGGLSSRMDGKDKGLQTFNNQAMTLWVYQAISPFVDTVYINCNRNHTRYQEISPHTCSDTIAGFQGPLAGIVSLMSASDADYLLISPCDTPLLNQAFGKKMLAVLNDKLADDPHQTILIAAKDENRSHPLHLCISIKLKHKLEQAIENGEHRVMQWVRNNDVHWVDFSKDASPDNTDYFVNFNTLDALEKSQTSK